MCDYTQVHYKCSHLRYITGVVHEVPGNLHKVSGESRRNVRTYAHHIVILARAYISLENIGWTSIALRPSQNMSNIIKVTARNSG